MPRFPAKVLEVATETAPTPLVEPSTLPITLPLVDSARVEPVPKETVLA